MAIGTSNLHQLRVPLGLSGLIYEVFDFLAVVYIVHLRSLGVRRCCCHPLSISQIDIYTIAHW